MHPRYNLAELINMINKPYGQRCSRITHDSIPSFFNGNGSVHNHQDWPGGYWDHITEVMNYAVIFYHSDPRPLPFSLSSALLVLFLHDIEKPWKYETGPDGQIKVKQEFDTEEKSHAFRDNFIRNYGIQLTPDEQNALKYVHGEGNDYSGKRRVMTPLAAFCHVCDVWVARIRFDCPMKERDPWVGAHRIQDPQ